LLTQGKFSQRYGRFEARVKIPRGQGIWPAVWMLREDFPATPWPHCGEIDILESVGPVADIAYGTLHGPGYSGDAGISRLHHAARPLSEDFHVYAVEWDEGSICWFVDEECYSRVTPDTLGGHAWVFDKPFFLLMNLAIGGNWPGYPDETTTLPQRMLIDYVRVYKQG
ncbi:glycoside hydrolase family 16 protein, partial [bacterium]